MIARRLAALSVCALALAATGCADKGKPVTKADTEGVWVDVGPLDYHIQGSRALNPAEVPDDRYLEGVPASVRAPTGEETWFAVFLRIENKSKKAAPTAQEFEIEDTQGDRYTPIDIDTKINPFAYSPQTLGTDEAMPAPDSTQEFDSAAGSMLLFKLPLTTIANRPLEFKIHAPAGSGGPQLSEVDLDV